MNDYLEGNHVTATLIWRGVGGGVSYSLSIQAAETER